MSPFLNAAVELGQWVFIAYFVLVNAVYLTLTLTAARMVRKGEAALAAAALPPFASGLEPGISLLVPAFNEETTIAASVASLLQLDYPDFEIIVINDGSTDNTLAVLQREFGLRVFPEAYRVMLEAEPIRAVYCSARYPRLRIIDKFNGGKSDALNVGLNAARHEVFCAVDADSIMQRDSLRRIARPFMEDRRVVACGGTVRIANGCDIQQGFLRSVGVPRNHLARVQVVEYLRAFLFGRLGWSPFNALLLISGAFGLFRVAAVVEAGGYRRAAIGEDMELVVRLHRIARRAGREDRIVFVADPICWTEAPETLSVLRAQRIRWQRGLLESLWINRRLMFSRQGGAVGWLAMPLMVVIEALGPAIEMAGYALAFVAVIMGLMPLNAALAFLAMAVGLGLMLSASALLLEEMAFGLYPRWSQLRALTIAMVLENLGYRQLCLWWRVQGTWKWLCGRPAEWGVMTRRAAVAPSPLPTAPLHAVPPSR